MGKINLSLLASAYLCANLYAMENNNEIVVYSATKSDQSIKDVTSSVEIITGAELESKQITNLTGAINLASGISFTRDGGLGQATKINIRGMHQTNTLVLIDGIRLNDITNANGVAFEILNMTDVERIEVIKGAQSGIWGADASGGVINIITKKQEQTKEKISVLLENGSFSTQKVALNLGTSSKDGYVRAGFNKIETDGFSAQTSSNKNLDDVERDGFLSTTLYVKTGFNLTSNDTLEFNVRSMDSEGDYDAYLSPDDRTRIYNTNTNIHSINYKHQNDNYAVDLYTQKSSFKRNYPNDFTKQYSGLTDTIGFKSKINYRGNDFVIIGSENNDYKDKGLDKGYGNKAYFFTNSNRFNNTISTVSVRKDDNDKFGDNTTGKIGLKQLYKDMFISMNYGTAFKAPTLNQLYTPSFGNEKLKAEETKSYDINLGYQGLEVSYFKNKIENLISFHPVTFQNINLEGQSTIKGYELSYKKTLNNLLVSLSYTSINAKDKDNHKIGRIPKENAKLSFDYFGMKKFNFNINVNYVGERYDRNYSSTNTPTPNGEQTGKYTVINTVINYKHNKSTSFYVKVDNIGDKKYEVVDGYSTSPRAYYAGLKYNF